MAFTHFDSADVLIALTQKVDPRTPIGWTVDSVPELIIGGSEDPEDQLYRIQGIAPLPHGGIVIVDAGSRELRFFDSEGRIFERVGGRGEGPGEFQDPVLVDAVNTDSLLIWDRQLRRFQAFSNDGRFLGTIPLKTWPRTAGNHPPIGTVGRRMLIRGTGIMMPDYARSGGAKEDSVHYSWFDPADGGEVLVSSFTVVRNFISMARGRPPGMSLIPFSSHPSATVLLDGALITDGRAYEVREYDFHGRLSRILRVAGMGRPVTAEALERKIDLDAAAAGVDRALYQSMYSEMPIPDTLPSFQGLRLDETGWLWAQEYEWDPTAPTTWMLFDKGGRARGTVRGPSGFETNSIGEDFLLGVWTDDLGVEQVRRYRLRRGSMTDSDPPSGESTGTGGGE